ncbi:MAG TPA: hypothetical protein VJ694_05290, partial [Patescibacteria group bacterium]|nr:hypothetical protein [Patescibacteria group bacterium]
MPPQAFLLAALSATLMAAPARADTVQAVGDRAFSLSMRAGVLHTDDDLFNSTWVRPAMLGGTAWLVRGRRRWLNGLQAYGLVGLESASISYSESPTDYEDGLSGIYRADIDIATGVTLGFGGRLSFYDDGRFHLSGFADAALPAGSSKVRVNALLIDLNGLRIDVAKAVQDNAEVTFSGRTYRFGGTAGVSLRSHGAVWIPYLTVGWLRYSADIRFGANKKLTDALTRFGVSSDVLNPRRIVEDDPFFAPGVRIDLGRDWS